MGQIHGTFMDAKDALIVSVSGVRGVVGSGLAPETVCAFAAALASHLDGGKVVLSRDGRPSGEMLRHAALAGLLGAGCEVHDLGITPTPTVGFAVRRLRADGGLQITASHNPAEWNGLKLFNRQGCIYTAAEGLETKSLFESNTLRRVPWDQIGTVTECRKAEEWHLDRIMELVDADRIRAAQLEVFLDANGGAGGPLGRRLLDAFQCNPICHACEADGIFQHEPEPVAENLQSIGPLVAEHGADIGFVLDPDADRLALIDETGRYIGEELTLALAVRFRLSRERGPVVVNMSTSRVVEDIAKQFDCPFYRAPVGEANVVEKMREVGAVIGGEGNGGVIDPRVGLVRDPFIGMGLIVKLMAESSKKLSTLVSELPEYHIVKTKHAVDPNRMPMLLTKMESHWPDPRINRTDGVRLDWNDRWVHVRASNTEPIVRIIAEAPTNELARTMCDNVGNFLTASGSE